VQNVLEKELSKPDQVYDVGQDLLADSYSMDTQPNKPFGLTQDRSFYSAPR